MTNQKDKLNIMIDDISDEGVDFHSIPSCYQYSGGKEGLSIEKTIADMENLGYNKRKSPSIGI